MSTIDREDRAHAREHAGDYEGTELVATAHARNYNRWILDAIRPYVGGTVVEVGAGRGNFTHALHALGPERLIALEPSRLLFPELRASVAGHERVEARAGTLEDAAADLEGSADSVVYINVLEHIEDDAAELARARRLLKPGGFLCVFVPALPWLASRFDESVGHHRRYGRRALSRMAGEAGYDVVEARWFDLVGIATWLLAFRVLRLEMQTTPVVAYDRTVVPLARLLDRVTGPPVGKSLLLIARKRA